MSGGEGVGQVEGIVIRPYSPGDEGEINRSFNEVFKTDRTLDHWRRKFPDPSYTMLAVDEEGRVVGQYAAIPVLVQVDGKRVRAGQVVDVFALPAARRGLATSRGMVALARAFFDRFGGPHALSFLYGFPGVRAYGVGVARLVYDAMPPEEVLVWTAPVRPRRRFYLGIELLEDPTSAAWDELWQAASPRYQVAGVRDGRWLERRFPGTGEYYRVVVCRFGKLAAGMVLRQRGAIMMLAELVWGGARAGLVAALEHARALAWERRCRQVELWLGGDREAAAVLAEIGWRASPHPDLRRVARSFDPAVEVRTFPGRFLLTLGDTDLV